jgi:hypothetical protein
MRKKLACLLTLIFLLGSINISFAMSPGNSDLSDPQTQTQNQKKDNKGIDLRDIVDVLKNQIDGDNAFDYLSYVYLGWRTTGGPWQNHVIRDFVAGSLEDAGYQYSDEDMSSATDGDYVWIQQDDSNSLVWAPEYASLEVTSEGDPDLIETFNVESYSFDPTSDTYIDYYNQKYGINNIEDMYEWITTKEADGTRINVANGLEADLNMRAHLASNTCFTDPSGTAVGDAKGEEGEVVYIGTVKNTKINGKTVYYGTETGLEGNVGLAGKILLTDSSNSTAFSLAKQTGAIATMTTAALDDYNNPVIDGEMWYTNSARYAGGTKVTNSKAQMDAGVPVVAWNLSLDQKAAIDQLLKDAAETGETVTVKTVSIGDIYPMSIGQGGEGQLTAIAEIKGTTKADERVLFMAHVQEPGACDNASGVGLQLEMATKLKKMVDEGVLERPERTITFFWGDEMTCSKLWMDAHPDEKANVVCAIDLDMVGEDPEKTGGPMRIEKTPDPSAFYQYTLDVLPGQEPYTSDEFFVRQPDSHTLWGAGDPPEISGLFLNDLYMASTQEVIRSVDPDFNVAVCPFEGGSDHQVFLEAGVPAVLTWHFTDYIYHTSVDTLDKASAVEMKNVGITSLAAGYFAAAADEYETMKLMDIVYNAAVERFRLESVNTENHIAWAYDNGKNIEEELNLEIEILTAWSTWYTEAIQSCNNYFSDEESGKNTLKLEEKYKEKIAKLLEKAIDNAEKEIEHYKTAAAS